MRRRWTSEDKAKYYQAERRAAVEVVKWERICHEEGQKATPYSRGSYTQERMEGDELDREMSHRGMEWKKG